MVSWSQDLSRKQGCFSKRNKNWRTPVKSHRKVPKGPLTVMFEDVRLSKALRNWRLLIARCQKQETSHYTNSHPWRTHQHPISSTVAGSFKRGIPTYPPFPPPSSTQKKAVWSLPQEFWVHHSASVLWINWQDSNSRFELPPSPEKPPKKPWTTWNRLPCWNFHHNAVWRAGPEAVIDRAISDRNQHWEDLRRVYVDLKSGSIKPKYSVFKNCFYLLILVLHLAISNYFHNPMPAHAHSKSFCRKRDSSSSLG